MTRINEETLKTASTEREREDLAEFERLCNPLQEFARRTGVALVQAMAFTSRINATSISKSSIYGGNSDILYALMTLASELAPQDFFSFVVNINQSPVLEASRVAANKWVAEQTAIVDAAKTATVPIDPMKVN